MTKDKRTILVVDDNPTNLSVLINYLKESGFEIMAAEDGEDALEQLEYVKPDIILLDVMMPNIDGFETCRRLKNIPEVKDVPVIFMTALADPSDKVKGFEVGAVDYITKPIQYEEVLARVTTHLTIHELQNELEQRVADRTYRLQAIATLSGQLNRILDLSTLLNEMVNQFKDNFGYYHAHVYLIDETTGDLVVAEGSGDIGKALKAKKHHLKMGQGIVGQVANNNEPIMVNNVDAVPFFFRNPLLPETKSELALPIHLGDKVMGVLDVQSEKVNAFTDEDVSMMQSIADQAAIAVDNARLVSQQKVTIAKLKELDQAKSQFITMMSHELRTPLNAVLGFSELLLLGLEGELSERVRDDVERIHNNGKHLLALINDIIDISQIEGGMISISLDSINAGEVIDEVLAATGLLLNEKPIEIITDISDELPFVYADHTRLNQILVNLIKNAIKFTNEGTITVKASMNGEDKIRFSVIDTGVGIPVDKQQAIFEQFRQADMSDTRQYGGIGVGLSLCKQLVELQKGEIGVISEEGVGSEFYFTIPTANDM